MSRLTHCFQCSLVTRESTRRWWKTTAISFHSFSYWTKAIESSLFLLIMMWYNDLHGFLGGFEDFRSQKMLGHTYCICKVSRQCDVSYESSKYLIAWTCHCTIRRYMVFPLNDVFYGQSSVLESWNSYHSQQIHTWKASDHYESACEWVSCLSPWKLSHNPRPSKWTVFHQSKIIRVSK